MGPIILAAVLTLIVIVMALSGAKLAQRATIMMGGLVAATLLAIAMWFFLSPA